MTRCGCRPIHLASTTPAVLAVGVCVVAVAATLRRPWVPRIGETVRLRRGWGRGYALPEVAGTVERIEDVGPRLARRRVLVRFPAPFGPLRDAAWFDPADLERVR